MMLHRHVLGDPEQPDEALEPAVLGDVADPGRDRRVRPAAWQLRLLPSISTEHRLVLVRSHDHAPERCHAGSQQPRDADTFTRVHGQGGAEQRAACRGRHDVAHHE